MIGSVIGSVIGETFGGVVAGQGSTVPANAITTDAIDPVVTTATSEFITTD
jgi:hypothetical protein